MRPQLVQLKVSHAPTGVTKEKRMQEISKTISVPQIAMCSMNVHE